MNGGGEAEFSTGVMVVEYPASVAGKRSDLVGHAPRSAWEGR